MIRCKKCGAVSSDSSVVCPNCKEKIRLVPDYYSTESVSYAIRKKRELEAAERRKKREAAAIAKRELELQKKRRIRARILFAAAAVLILLTAVFSFLYIRDSNSFSYQMDRAAWHLSKKRYDLALSYADRAERLDKNSIRAKLLKSEILIGLRRVDAAEDLLLGLTGARREETEVYERLIGLYYDRGEFEKIKSLLDGVTSDKIKDRFAPYICGAPEFLVPEGHLDAGTGLGFLAQDASDAIYYTTNGSNPDILCNRYTSPVTLAPGTYTVKAIAYNAKGIMSDTVTKVYTITDG